MGCGIGRGFGDWRLDRRRALPELASSRFPEGMTERKAKATATGAAGVNCLDCAVGECGDAEFGGGVGDEGDLLEGLGGGNGARGDGVGYAVDCLPGF